MASAVVCGYRRGAGRGGALGRCSSLVSSRSSAAGVCQARARQADRGGRAFDALLRAAGSRRDDVVHKEWLSYPLRWNRSRCASTRRRPASHQSSSSRSSSTWPRVASSRGGGGCLRAVSGRPTYDRRPDAPTSLRLSLAEVAVSRRRDAPSAHHRPNPVTLVQRPPSSILHPPSVHPSSIRSLARPQAVHPTKSKGQRDDDACVHVLLVLEVTDRDNNTPPPGRRAPSTTQVEMARWG